MLNKKIRAALAALGFAAFSVLALHMGGAFGQTLLLPNLTGTTSDRMHQIDHIGVVRVSRIDSITATASGTLANSYVLDRGMTIIGTVTTTNDSVTLPTLSGAVQIMVQNGGANTLKVWPNCSSCKIDTGSAGAGITVAANKLTIFTQATDGLWYSVTSP